MSRCGIYAIINTATHSCYVGSAVDFHVRKLRHLNELRQGKHHSQHMQRAYLKYGEKAFAFIFLEDVPKDKHLLFLRESHWIQLLQPEYNVGRLSATALGAKRTEEVRKRQSEAALARPKPTEETKQILSDAAKTRAYTETGRQKRSAYMKTRWQKNPLSEESRRKSAEGNRAYWQNLSEEERQAITVKRMAGRKPISEETRLKMRLAKLGKPRNPEAVEKTAAKHRNKVISEQTRANMRAAQQKLAAEKRAANPKPPKVYKTDEAHRRKTSEGLQKSWARRKASQNLNITQPPLLP